MLSQKQRLYVSTLALSLMSLAACQPTEEISATRNLGCSAFETITYSSKDTLETRRQITLHNAVWRELCE